MKDEIFHFDLIGRNTRNKQHNSSLQVISERAVADYPEDVIRGAQRQAGQ